MIPDIKEIYVPPYATLTSAQVSQSDMGDKVITATVKIDGNIVPDFSYDWEVEFQGERYIHSARKPQASKENTDIRSSIDLTFRHWAVVELQRYFFFEFASVDSGTAIPDKYVTPLTLTLPDFIIALNKVLAYWYGDDIKAELFTGDATRPAWQSSEEPSTLNISYTHVWDLLTSEEFYNAYGCRWQMVANPDHSGGVILQFGFPTTEINHIFEYGFKGGLLKVERQVQSDDIRNVLLGRGGEKNVPYRYFKDIDPDNPSFAADPDWIPELANIYFDRIRDAAFRSYVQGWKYKHYRDSYEVGGQFITKENSAVDWAWELGYTDTKFNPVEFVKDDASIKEYGERWGALDDNDDIYPTIQGITRDPIGRIDQVVDVGAVVTNEEAEESSSGSAEISQVPSFDGTARKDVRSDPEKGVGEIRIQIPFYSNSGTSSTITVPEGHVLNFDPGAPEIKTLARSAWFDTMRVSNAITTYQSTRVVFTNVDTNETSSAAGVPAGRWKAEAIVSFEYDIYNETTIYNIVYIDVTASFASATLTIGEDTSSKLKRYANTFDIWVKNIWNTTKGATESDEDYAERVWKPILGDRDQNTAQVVFSSGWLSISESYEFEIVNLGSIAKSIHYDTSRMHDGVQSHWRLTLACSQADLDTLGVLIPNERTHANAGDYFFFIGIDLPYLYYTEAEKRLTSYKQDQLRDVADIKPTWVVTLDKVRIGRKQYDDITPLLSQLRVGATLRLTDPRFLQTVEPLYIQSITYNYNEPTKDDPYIVPDVEIVLSDRYETTANPVAMLQGSVNALARQVGSISNIEQIVRMIGDRLYLRKDGITDLSYSPTQFNSLVTSKDFRIGNIGGAGWGLYRDINGNAVFEVDRAIVRQDFEVNNLVVNQVSARGGMIVESAASMECTLVVENYTALGLYSYTCYFDQKQGSVSNLFRVDDVAYCQRWDSENKDLKFYKRRVLEVGADYIVLSAGLEFMLPFLDNGVNGTGVPEQGDNIIQFGNYADKNRQFVIIRDVVGGGYERFIEGLNSVNASGTEYFFVGRQQGQDPRFFIGGDKTYMEWTPSNGLVVKGKISSLSTIDDTDTTLQDALDREVTIGGINLFPNTNQGVKGWILTSSSGVSLKSNTDNYGVGLVSTWDYQPGYYYMNLRRNIPDGVLEVDNTYTISFKTKGTSSDETSVYIHWDGGSKDAFLGAFYPGEDFSSTFEAPASDDVYIRLTPSTGVRYELELWDLMLEEGSVASPWQPAPSDMNYIKRALQETGSIDGGLILGSLLQLGYTDDNGDYQVQSGLNGIYSQGDTGHGIAFWAGGKMKDAWDFPSATDKATSVIRMDGTGYLAGGTISFEQNEVWLGDNVTVNDKAVVLSDDAGVERIRITNMDIPSDLAQSVSNPTTINTTGSSTALRIYSNGALQTSNGTTQTSYALSSIRLTGTAGDVANLTIRVSLSGTSSLPTTANFVAYVQVALSTNTSAVYKAYFAKSSSSGLLEAEVVIPSYAFTTSSVTISLTMRTDALRASGTYVSTNATPSVTGSRQGIGKNMTLIGANGLLSAWNNTALGINGTSTIMRAGNYLVQTHMNRGIQFSFDGGSTWYTLSRGSDGTARLS